MPYLNYTSWALLLSAGILGASAIGLFALGKTKISVYTLVAASFLIALFFAQVDPFLYEWDEQFHALVSKHMLAHMLKPTLYETPILNYNYGIWTENHIWLHKQPLFMWQMAISQFFFGQTAFAIRFPDVVLHAILTFLIFDIGKIIKNEAVGFLAALFFTFLIFPLNLISGIAMLDHNDFTFMFYITASFWAYVKHQQTKKLSWAILAGVFVGCAILIKWLPGLLIYLCWFFALAYQNKNIKKILAGSKPIIVSVLVACAVFIPWQLYCYTHYPTEYQYEVGYNSTHITQAVENHTGTWAFHFNAMYKLYGSGELVPYIILLSFLFFLYNKTIAPTHKILIATAIVFVYLFYTIVQTKMVAFTVIVLPLVIIVLANFISTIISLIKNKRVHSLVFALSATVISFMLFDIGLVFAQHTPVYKNRINGYRDNNIKSMKQLQALQTILKDDDKIIVFNCQSIGYIKTMFYTNYTAYDFIPTQQQYTLAKNSQYKIVVIQDSLLPPYIQNDAEAIKITLPKF